MRSICDFCNLSYETTFHFLVDCAFSRACWQEACIDVGIHGVVSIRGCFSKVITDSRGFNISRGCHDFLGYLEGA